MCMGRVFFACRGREPTPIADRAMYLIIAASSVAVAMT